MLECFICRRDGGEVGKVQGSKVARWEVPGLTQGWGTQGESKISSFCF